jgi:uncharacterized protein YndB with AHSA1/START domain
LTRVFNAPRRLVFEAWTRPEHLKRWWAPKGCTTPFCTVDLRVGGLFHYCIRRAEGQEVWGRGIYREIVEPERIAFVDSFADKDGNAVAPEQYGMSAGQPHESLVTVTFTEHHGKTEVTLHHAIPASVQERADMEQGWSEMLERLAEVLGKPEAGE